MQGYYWQLPQQHLTAGSSFSLCYVTFLILQQTDDIDRIQWAVYVGPSVLGL